MIKLEPNKALRPIVRSEYWDTLVSVLEERKQSCLMQLLNCGEHELKRIQGQVQELDYLLNMRTAIIAESVPRKP